jgi:hypothetical protein
MAKTDSFFIRASVQTDNAADAQTSIDLGAYVDALGKSVLRIHNLAVRYDYSNSGPSLALAGPGVSSAAQFQLTTQSQTALVGLTDKSVIASGALEATNDTAAVNAYSFFSQDVDIAPQHWNQGYLVGVEQIYLLGSIQGSNFQTAPIIEVVMECTVETLSSSAAMALALSQQ